MYFGAVFLTLVAISGCQAELSEVAKSNDNFTSDIYKNLGSSEHGNIIFSGLSANLILSLLANGAKGDTQTELIQKLHLIEKEQQRNGAFKELTSSLNTNTEDLKVLAANKIYSAEKFPISQTFKQSAVDYYNSDVENLNFGNKEEAANTINRWVEEKTNNKIQNLVDSKQLDENTKLVLVNSLYFSGQWLEPFAPAREGLFFPSETDVKKLNVMQNTVQAKYRECGYYQAKFLELDFKGKLFSITFILPNNVTGLGRLEADLKGVVEPHDMKTGLVVIYLPKFRIDTTVDLVPQLQKLGVQKIFNNGADLSGISSQQDLQVDAILQKAFIDVTEYGVEAAAATFVGITPLMHPEPEFTFKADHPFLFYIREKKSGAVLFTGRFSG